MKAAESKRDIYEARKIEAIYNNLLSLQTSGNPSEYEIRIDDFPVVGRTADLESFMGYSEFIDSETKTVGIILYKPTSTRSYARYFFYFSPDALRNSQLLGIQRQNPLGEIEISERIRKELEHDALQKENAQLKIDIEELKDLAAKFEKENNDLKAKRIAKFEQVGSFIIDGALSRIGDKFLTDPGLGNINPTQNQEQASFKRKDKEEEETEDVDAEEACYLSEKEKVLFITLRAIGEKHGSAFLEKLFMLNYLVTENPKVLDFLIKQAESYIKSRPNTNQQGNEKV